MGLAKWEPTGRSGSDDLEPYYRLIEMQRQMMELVHQNELAQRECAELRAQLAREADQLYRVHSSVGYRLRKTASGLLRRLWWREAPARPAPLPSAVMLYRLEGRGLPERARRT